MPKRIGTSRVSDVPADILAQLETGTIESATLSEGLAINFAKLLSNIFPDLGNSADEIIDPKAGITKRMAAASDLIVTENGPEAIKHLEKHPSDTVRGWAAYAIAGQSKMSLGEKLNRLRPLANDSHFGVREWSWLAIRPDIVKLPNEAISFLTPWTSDQSDNIRRFASEATRPRGVWSAHIKEFKTNPELALPLIAPLKSDNSRYVQDSVANWLNDAFKSQPDWVTTTCKHWQKQSSSDETAYIVKRGLRSRKT